MLNNMRLPPIFMSLPDEERKFFLRLAEKNEKELLLHEHPGKLWEKDEQGKDWSNVTEHCLVEAARVNILALLLRLPDGVRNNLVSAAALHDFNKKEEIRLTREDIAAGGSGRRGVLIAEKESEEILRIAGFPDLVISLIGHVSGDPDDVRFMKGLLDLPSLAPEDIAHLVMHYVDNYTRGSSWVQPAEQRGGVSMNEVDRRNAENAANPKYAKMNFEGLAQNEAHPFFKGLTRFEAAAALNHLIEKKFVDVIRGHGVDIGDPSTLPEFVDARIKESIYVKSDLL